MKSKLNAKEIILSVVKAYPQSLDELLKHFKEYNKKISKNNLNVNITRLVKEGLVIRDGDKILYSDPFKNQWRTILQELEGISLEKLKYRFASLKILMSLIKKGKMVEKKLELVI